MKFLCPSCKAKYQIADDKVAGRSVRMKCRKCGHVINISKTVTEGSASARLDGLKSSRPPPPEEPAPAERPARPAPPSAWREPGMAPARAAPKPPPRPGASGATPRAPAARAAAALAPAVAPKPVRPPGRGSNGSGNGSSSHQSFGGKPEVPSYGSEDERTVIAGIGALAGAFSESVTGPDSSVLAASLASTDEWYVGINGVPVGPIRLSELRSKAAAGAISSESLVWREGFEQWMALANFPELVAIVEEGISSARASLTPMSPTALAIHGPTPPAAPRPEVYDPFAMPGAPTPTPVGVLSDPFAATVRQSSPDFQPGPFGSQPVQLTSAVPAPVFGAPLPQVEIDEALPPRRRGGSLVAWVAVGVALMLGLTIGFVSFSRKPAEPIVKYIEVPAKGGEVPAAAVGTVGSSAEEIVITTADGGVVRVAKAGVGGGKPGDKPEEKPLTGLQGLSGLQAGGPTTGPATGGTTAGGNSGQPLESGEIQKTVGKYTGSVKRSCWQPALDARAKDAPTSARVNVTIVVAPSGSVQSVKTSGDPKGYPGLGTCIASRVRGWQFPASSGTTTVNVPFVFASQ